MQAHMYNVLPGACAALLLLSLPRLTSITNIFVLLYVPSIAHAHEHSFLHGTFSFTIKNRRF